MRAGDEGSNFTSELCTNNEDYKNTGIHYHEETSASDMHWYFVESGTSTDGKTLTEAGTVELWYDWLPYITDWKFERDCIAYNVNDNVVAKHR